MWTVEVTFHDELRDKRLIKFNDRPTISEGFNLIRFQGETEGELWLASKDVKIVRVIPDPTSIPAGI